MAQADDGDLYEVQVVVEQPLFLRLLLLHQEVNLQLLKAHPLRVDERNGSDLCKNKRPFYFSLLPPPNIAGLPLGLFQTTVVGCLKYNV